MVDIWFLGQACFKVKGKSATLVFDPYNAGFTGLPAIRAEADIVCVSHDHNDHNEVASVKPVLEGSEPFRVNLQGEPFVIAGPGEYEKGGVNVVGVASFHDDSGGSQRGKNTIYNVTVDDINIVHLGDLGQKKLTQEQIEQLSSCDVLLIPVGGVYTIAAKDAPDIISELEPKIIVPMHYKIEGLKFDLEPVESFMKVMGKENFEVQPKLSVSRDKLPEEPEVVVLEV